jgi:hypothetical protein
MIDDAVVVACVVIVVFLLSKIVSKASPQKRLLRVETPSRTKPETADERRRFSTTLRGITHPNRDGSSRQEILRGVGVGNTAEVEFEEENDNPKDPNAVEVVLEECGRKGQQIGYVPWKRAPEFRAMLRRNPTLHAMAKVLKLPYATRKLPEVLGATIRGNRPEGGQ